MDLGLHSRPDSPDTNWTCGATYLHEVRECDTDHQEFVHGLEQFWVGEHTVIETHVEEVCVVREHVVYVVHLKHCNHHN